MREITITLTEDEALALNVAVGMLYEYGEGVPVYEVHLDICKDVMTRMGEAFDGQ